MDIDIDSFWVPRKITIRFVVMTDMHNGRFMDGKVYFKRMTPLKKPVASILKVHSILSTINKSVYIYILTLSA